MTIEWTQLFAAQCSSFFLFPSRVPKLLPNLSPSPARVIDIYFVSYAALSFIPTPFPTAAQRKLFPFALLFLKREPRLDSFWLRVALVSSLSHVFQRFKSLEYRFSDFEICGSRYCIREFHVISHRHVLPKARPI